MEKFVEKKIVNVFKNIIVVCAVSMGLSLLFCFLLLSIGLAFESTRNTLEPILNTFMIILVSSPTLAMPFIALSSILSKKEKYTKEFIKYIRNKIDNSKSLTEFYEIQTEFKSIVLDDNGKVHLSNLQSLIDIKKEINYKIEILESINGTGKISK